MTAKKSSKARLRVVGPDIEDETEEIRDSQGRVIDEAYVDADVAEAHAYFDEHPEVIGNAERDPNLRETAVPDAVKTAARRRGRPAISPDDEASVRITVRLSPQSKVMLDKIAQGDGMTTAEWVRLMIDKYVAVHSIP